MEPTNPGDYWSLLSNSSCPHCEAEAGEPCVNTLEPTSPVPPGEVHPSRRPT